jgi:hypothetical protein
VNFFALNLKAFRKVGLLLFLIGVLSSQIDQSISSQVEEALRNPQGLNSAVYIYGFLSLIFSLFFPLILILLCLWALKPTASAMTERATRRQVSHFFKHNFPQLVIETLRSWGKILLWSLLFIIPGVIKYVVYVLVPFIVATSPAYDRGELDALQTSTRLVKKHAWEILALIFVFHLTIPLILTVFFDEYRLMNQTPIASLALSLLDAYLFLISTQCFLWVIQKSPEIHEIYQPAAEATHAVEPTV